MPALTAAEAKRWLKVTKQTLLKLDSVYPLACRANELPIVDIPETSRFKILRKLVDAGLAKKVSDKPGKYAGCRDRIHKAVEDDKIITTILWPPEAIESVQEELEIASSNSQIAKIAEPQIDSDQKIALAPPPPIAGLELPPSDASHEMVIQWIFTILHAQTQNLIYIREQVDKLVKGLGA